MTATNSNEQGGEATKRTMTLNLSEREMEVLEELSVKKDMSKTAVIRQALRLYQLIDKEIAAGRRLSIGDPPVGLDILY